MARSRLTQLVTSATLQAASAACVMVANLPRGRRRTWSRYRPWDLLKSHAIAQRLHDGDRVLDVGCGTGHTLAQLALFRRIVPQGVDLAVMNARFPEIPIAAYDGRTLPFVDGAFDATLLCYVMHHLPPGEAAALFAETARVTRRRIFLLEDSLPAFSPLYRLRNRLHRIEAGLRYCDASPAYSFPPDEAMFKTHDGWRDWLGAQPRVTAVTVESFADIARHDHHTLFEVTLGG